LIPAILIPSLVLVLIASGNAIYNEIPLLAPYAIEIMSKFRIELFVSVAAFSYVWGHIFFRQDPKLPDTISYWRLPKSDRSDGPVQEKDFDEHENTLARIHRHIRKAMHISGLYKQIDETKWCIRQMGGGFRGCGLQRIVPIRGSPAMTLRVRAVSEEEREIVGQMARSRTLGAGLVRRAQIVLHALEGLKAPEISARMGLCGATVRHWLKRFDARGLHGLEEDVRAGRPPTYSAAQRSAVIDTALTRPADLGLPFAS
jgi:hypothetical protein